MLKMIAEQEFQARDVLRALGLMFQILDELDGPMQAKMVESGLIETNSAVPASRPNSQGARGNDGHGTPEGQEEDTLTGVRNYREGSAEEGVRQSSLEPELRKMKEELEKLFPLLSFTPSRNLDG